MTGGLLPPDFPDFRLAACGNDQAMALYDRAVERPGGPAADRFRRAYCEACPAREACLAWALEHDEPGVWGGTTPTMRTRMRSGRSAGPAATAC